MKHFLAALALVASLQLHAQSSKLYNHDSNLISQSARRWIELSSPADSLLQKLSLPFSGFVFKDVRADTSYIGVNIRNDGMGNKSYRKLILMDGTATLANYFNKAAGITFVPGDTKLVCFIKQMRLTEIDSITKNNDRLGTHYRLRFIIEGYFKKGDKYFPALRADTTAISYASKKTDYGVFAELLNILVAKVIRVNMEQCFRRNEYSLAELESRYSKANNKPIVLAKKPNKGIYRSFAEFADNNPSVSEYQFTKDKKALVLYTKDNSGNWMPERNAYGFCDGKTLWLNVNNVFKPLIAQGKTFEFLAQYNPAHFNTYLYIPRNYPAGSPATWGLSLLGTGIANAMTPDFGGTIVYQLDMETGSYY